MTLAPSLEIRRNKVLQSRNAVPMSGNASILVIGPTLLAFAWRSSRRAEITR
jgi:hypothetical protein